MTAPRPDNEAIFHAARDIPDPDHRREFVRAACGGDEARVARIEALLAAADARDSLLDHPVGRDPVATIDEPAAESPGMLIGPYKLIEQIGEGGMGMVWVAQQTEPVKRLVAVKLIKAGMDSKQVIARFEAERQALALMDHPNIARVLDGGTTGAGRPYFVMDLVKGVPITKYCDEHRLTPKQRLELFLPVCQAVQHAHQKGIIHRDLKPSNVLVAQYDGRPVPKVIDFGVAKAAGQSLTDKTLVTGFGNIVGTLEYMSPEQAEVNQLDIDTRSDIYSLGVLLYELLTGTTPLEKKRLSKAAMLEVLRLIREEEPPRPSTRLSESNESLPSISAQRQMEPAKLTKLVRGELDWIVMKALEKDRNRRYETANGFAADVQRYLADEPVLACPPSTAYRLRKMVRRHKMALSMTGIVAACALVLAGVGAWLLWQRGTGLRDAESAFTIAEDAQKRRDRQAARAALERAEARLPRWGAGVLADRIHQFRLDIDTLDRVDEFRLNLFQRNNGSNDVVYAARDAGYVEMFRLIGVDPDADGPKKAAEELRRHAGVADFAAALDDWAWLRRKEKKQAEARWRPLLETARLADDDPTRTRIRDAAAAGDWATIQRIASGIDFSAHPPLSLEMVATYLEEASDDYRPIVAFLRQARLQYPDDFWINSSLGSQLHKPMLRDAYTEMISCYSAALVVRPRSAGALQNLAGAYIFSGNFDQGLAVCKRMLDLELTTEIRAHVLQNMAIAYKYKEDRAQALAAIDEVLKTRPDDHGAHHMRGMILLTHDPDAALVEGQAVVRLCEANGISADMGHELISLAYANKKQFDKAAASMREALRLGSYSPASEAIKRDELGHMLMDANDYEGALAEFQAAIKLEPDFVGYHLSAGMALSKLNRYEQAKGEYVRFFQAQERSIPEAFNKLGHVFRHAGKNSEAEAACRTAALLDPKDSVARYNLGLLLNNLHRYPEAIVAFREAIAIKPDVALYHNDLAIALEISGQKQECLKEARIAVDLCDKGSLGDKPGCVLELGNCLRVNGNERAAEEAYREAIRLKPDYAMAFDNLGTSLVAQEKVPDAIKAYRKALEVDPNAPLTRGNLAMALANSGQPAEALPLLEEAVRRQPMDTRNLVLLGVVKNRLSDLPGAAKELRRALELAPGIPGANCELGDVLRRQGRFAESLVAYQLGHTMGSRLPGWNMPSARLLREAERKVELDAKLPAVLKGEIKPRDGRERIEYADVARLRSEFAASARLYDQAFAEEPALAESRELDHRYNAACYAAQAGCGQGKDTGQLDEKERGRLRQQALNWLQSDLSDWQKHLEKEAAKARALIPDKLQWWQKDPDLAGVRDTDALKRLPEAERQAWQEFWMAVETLLKRATGQMK